MTAIAGPLWWQAICAGFRRSLARKGRRPNTLEAYGFACLDFGKWLELSKIFDAEHLTGSALERWQDSLAGHAEPSTQQMYAAALRGALRWAATQEPPLCPLTLWLRVSTPRTARLLPKPIPRADLDRLLTALAPVPPPSVRRSYLKRLRSRALFYVLISSGARINEALQLDRDQFQDRTATVEQKGGSQKLLVISETAEAAINDYLAARSDDGRALFVDHWHQPTRLTRSGAQRAWDQLCRQVGVARFHNHSVRHSCATELLRQGVDSITIAAHLGHRGLAHIQNYAEVGLDSRRQMLEVLDDRIRRAS